MAVQKELSEDLEDIQTGVDKLVMLLKIKRRVSVKDASKKLGVPEDVIKEWADFLENEGMLHADYSLTNEFLVYKGMTEDKKKEKTDEFIHRKENFLRRAQSIALALDVETETIQKIKNAFKKLELDVDFEVKDMQLNFDKIRRYEADERTLKKRIAEQYNSFIGKIAAIESKISKQEEVFNRIVEEIKQKSELADKEERKVNDILDEEYRLSLKLENLRNKTKDSEEWASLGASDGNPQFSSQAQEKKSLELRYVSRLLNFVKQSFKKGFTIDQIQRRLLASGWTKDQVDSIMSKVRSDQGPDDGRGETG
jgi:predicted ArsR family transcriptional regulator